MGWIDVRSVPHGKWLEVLVALWRAHNHFHADHLVSLADVIFDQ